ncbi:MAG TPA: PepSY-associated TM helix domain-containing protein [Steroidobacteraceae bacterium]|nr:PepSY-associated TM helix domain-containing protein [Steroidobacteraceae bacterium]
MVKNVLFQAHWLIGITAGVIVAIVGLTGAALSFEEELLHALNREIVTVAPREQALSVAELLAKVEASNPGKQVANINIFSDPTLAAKVTLVAAVTPGAESPPGQRRRGETRYLNPYTAELIGGKQLVGQEALQVIERTHRGMVAGATGRALVTISTIALIVLSLSGLYLRWPRSGALKLTTWFKIHTQLKGRAFLWNLHSVVGTWMMPIYVIVSLSGLYFGYDWYRQGMLTVLNASPVSREAPKLETPFEGKPDVARLWATFEQAGGGYESATLNFPANPKQAAEFRYLRPGAPHERATDRLALHPVTGAIIKQEVFADRTTGNYLAGSMMPLHSGSYFGVIGKLVVMLASLAMPVFAITGWMLYLKRRRSRQLATSSSASPMPASAVPESG